MTSKVGGGVVDEDKAVARPFKKGSVVVGGEGGDGEGRWWAKRGVAWESGGGLQQMGRWWRQLQTKEGAVGGEAGR